MRSLPLVLALVAALLGCSPKLNYPECKTDDDCKEQVQVCINGICRQCREDRQCKPGEVCKDNGCAPKPECDGNAACGDGKKCAGGKCVPECAPETAAQDCGAGRKCTAGRCLAEEACNADLDCSSGKACVNGLCRAGNTLAGKMDKLDLACQTKPALFGYDDSALSPEAREALDQAWQCLQRGAGRVVIAGHTDERGTTEYNVALGSRRAEAARRYLLQLGADPKRLRAVSFGKEQPADPGHDEAAWSRNRRVELVAEP